MKLTCSQANLAEAVTNVQRAVSSKTSLPVLEGILIKAKNDQITLCGYDLEIGITTVLSADITEEGSIVVSAKLLGDIVRRLPDETVHIETDDRFITYITSGQADYKIVGIAAADYPELPSFEKTETISIQSGLLKNMIKQTLFAVSDNISKPIYTGSLFDIENNVIKIVSVDGYRMALRKEAIDCEKSSRFVVPGKALSEVLKLVSDEEKNTEILIGQRHAIFKIENYTIFTRLIEGNFLDYKSTIPADSKTEACIVTRDLIGSVERMSLLTSDKIQSPIRFTVGEEDIRLSCSTAIGKANDVIKTPVKGEGVEIGFNNRYLLDALRNADTDIVKLELNGALTPMKIVPTQGDAFLFLVVPMRLNNEN